MSSEEMRELAVEREIIELQKIVKAFDQVVADAQRLAVETRESAERFAAVQRGEEIERKIDDLDYLMKRGKYANLRPSTVSKIFPEFHRDRSL